MREHFGPGWRMYYVKRGESLIVMLGGGDKGSQESDIAKAKQREATLEDWTMKKRIADLPDFDMAQQLKSEEDIAAYITIILIETTVIQWFTAKAFFLSYFLS